MGAHHHHHHHHHEHPFEHHHGGADTASALLWALVLNGGFLVVEAVAGWWTGSLALLSDAAHMTSDVAALGMAYGAARLARQRPSAQRTFGLHRAETLGAFVNGIALLAAVVWIGVEATDRLTHAAPDVSPWPVLLVGAVGLAINLGSAWALWRSDRENLNIRGALLHMLADALGSVGAVVAAGFLFAGVQAADAAIALFTALLVAWGSYHLLRDATRVLLQLPPPGMDVRGLLSDLSALEGVDSVHDLHVWTLDGREPIITAHLVLDDGADATAVVDQASHLAALDHGTVHATFQVERAGAGSPCASADCGAVATA